ncbi:MAG: hypothetical protein ABIR15_10960 [Chitinophagaceae bacterium]
MKSLFLLPAFFICQACLAQKQVAKDSIDFYLNKIDNHAVSISNNYNLAAVKMNNDAKILYDNADEYIIDNLMALLENENKALACHVLLTKLLEPDSKSFYYTTEDLTDSILVSYKYNGLVWKAVFDKISLTNKIRIDSLEMKKMKTYWLSKKESLLNKGHKWH